MYQAKERKSLMIKLQNMKIAIALILSSVSLLAWGSTIKSTIQPYGLAKSKIYGKVHIRNRWWRIFVPHADTFKVNTEWIFVITTHNETMTVSIDRESTTMTFQTKELAMQVLDSQIKVLKQNGWIEVPTRSAYGTTIRTLYKDGLVCNNYVLPITHAIASKK